MKLKSSAGIMSAAVIALCYSTEVRADTVIFSENFSGATPGPNNNLAGTGFTLATGNVDIVGVLNGSFFTCAANPAGNCLDLVGSPGAGDIRSTNFLSLTAGNTYSISFTDILQGFDSSSSATSNFDVQLGSTLFHETAIPTVQSTTLTFVASASDLAALLRFTTITEPDDVHGAVLSNIVVTEGARAVPGPVAGAGLPGLVFACGGLLTWWRRREQVKLT